MQRILEWIEGTLDADVSPQDAADAAGYSLWHFLHLFRQEVGMPLCRYRMRRRLAHAIWHMRYGASATEAALRWGFATHSGFYRAFRREYGCTPAEYLRTHHVRRPTVPRLKEETFRMLTRETCSSALKRWGLNLPVTPVTYPASGAVSDCAMYAGDEYLLKAYHDEGVCRQVGAVAAALAQQGLPAAQPLPLPDGAFALPLTDDAEGLHMMLFRRLPGQAMSTPEILAAPEENGRQMGCALAELHLALAASNPQPLVDELDYPAHLLDWALPTAADSLPMGFPADFADRVKRLPALPGSIIHRDPNPSNFIRTASGVGFIDFDMSVRAMRLFDPCYAATAVLSECFGRERLPWETAWPVFARALLEGYDSVSPLTEEEWQAVPTLMLGNELLALAAFVGSSKYREVFEVNQRMLSWLLEHLPV